MTPLKNNIDVLKEKAYNARVALIRAASKSGSPHIASSLSEIEIITTLYSEILRVTPATVSDPERDRFILSKGHAALGYYIILAQHGFLPMEEIERYAQDGTRLTAHPVYGSVPGIEATSGSLGHGLPIGLGMAIAHKCDKSAARTFVLLSDGECDEGSNWEAILLAGHLGLDSLTVIIDYNKLQGFGRAKEVLDLEPFADKWRAAHWTVQEVDGHSFTELTETLSRLPLEKGKPSVIIAHTVKGKGVQFMEDKLEWHYLNVKADDLESTLAQIYRV
jgi:transketolase